MCRRFSRTQKMCRIKPEDCPHQQSQAVRPASKVACPRTISSRGGTVRAPEPPPLQLGGTGKRRTADVIISRGLPGDLACRVPIWNCGCWCEVVPEID